MKEGLKELLDEISPVNDFTGKDLELSFSDYYLDEPKYEEKTAKAKNISFEAPQIKKKNILIDKVYVQKQLRDVLKDQDLRRFIL